MHYLQELNPIQHDAATEIQGPVMINAGPGSGKTRVLTYRIAFMMEQGIQPFNILALTFTNKASKEMRERIEKVNGTDARNLFMGTFHSVFARILRTKAVLLGYTNNFTIYDADDAKSVVKQIIKDYALNDDIYKPNIVYNRISSLKNNLINAKIYNSNADLQYEDEEQNRPRMGEVYKEYSQRCFKNNAMDFDDLLIKMYELLVRFPDQLYEMQKKFQYVLVDEFQDTNFAQYSIIRKIADMHQNVCVVGDDSQSIYAFRGASIENILNFQKDYPDAKVFKLEQNYRSTKAIVQAANTIIKNNKTQLEKTIWTDNVEGEKIKLIRTLSDNDEGKQIVEDIFDKTMTKQLPYSEIAILYRTNSQSRSFEEALRRKNIPYVIYGGISFYQRKEIKDLLAYLKLTVNPYEEEALKRVVNYPARGLGDTSMNRVMLYTKENNLKLWDVFQDIDKVPELQSRAKQVITDFTMMIKSFAIQTENNAHEMASGLAKSSGLLGELYKDKSVEGVSKYENLQELLNSIKQFVENDEVIENEEMVTDKSLGSFLQSVTLLTDQDKKQDTEHVVKLMTIHASKGLEFKAVYLVGVEENLFPSQRSLYSREDLEEERRLFYVAVTRAETYLTISYANSRYKFGVINPSEPSRFLKELPEEIVDFKGQAQQGSSNYELKSPNKQYQISSGNKLVNTIKSTNQNNIDTKNFESDSPEKFQSGQDVIHQFFGKGHINEITGEGDKRIASIVFNENQEKKIMLKFAKLKIV